MDEDLFDSAENADSEFDSTGLGDGPDPVESGTRVNRNVPLAARMRPRNLDEYVGLTPADPQPAR